MPEIRTTTGADLWSKMPEIVPWDRKLCPEGIDLLICCAGFEDRAIAVADDLSTVSLQSSILVQYPTNPTENASAVSRLRALRDGQLHDDVPYDRGTFLSRIRKAVARWRGQPGIRVVVDLSGMASYVVYRVLDALWEELGTAQLAVYYAEAHDYAPTREDWEAFYKNVPEPSDNLAIAESYEENHFQSVGVDDTYESDVFPGINAGPLATQVVAFPSFSLHRMKSLLAFAESHYNVRPDDVHWFLGQPPDRVRNGWRFNALSALYNVGGAGAAVSTRDYRDTFLRLDNMWSESFTDRHLVLAPLGSKMQHLACFLFLKMHNECGLLLCEPREFIASKYSSGIGPRWWLDFGEIGDLRRLLECRCDLQFDWDE